MSVRSRAARRLSNDRALAAGDLIAAMSPEQRAALVQATRPAWEPPPGGAFLSSHVIEDLRALLGPGLSVTQIVAAVDRVLDGHPEVVVRSQSARAAAAIERLRGIAPGELAAIVEGVDLNPPRSPFMPPSDAQLEGAQHWELCNTLGVKTADPDAMFRVINRVLRT